MSKDNDILDQMERHYPVEGASAPPPLRVVLVAGAIGDYAAYAGHGSIPFVAAIGQKLSFTEASAYFPQIQKEKYRN